MRIMLRVLVVLALVSGWQALARAEEDQWSDAHDTVDLSGAVAVRDLPLPTAGALYSSSDSPLDSAPQSSPDSSDDSSLEPGEEAADAPPAVELYITSWCGYCRRAREFLHARGIPFVEYDIERDATAARRKRELNGGPGVPVAVINGQVVVGFSDSVYESALRTVR